jgi:hypothetical protein
MFCSVCLRAEQLEELTEQTRVCQLLVCVIRSSLAGVRVAQIAGLLGLAGLNKRKYRYVI